MTAGQVLSVKRPEVETPCRRCGQPIEQGRMVALLVGVGAAHIRCLVDHGRPTTPSRSQLRDQ